MSSKHRTAKLRPPRPLTTHDPVAGTSINKVILVDRLVADPELRTTAPGSQRHHRPDRYQRP